MERGCIYVMICLNSVLPTIYLDEIQDDGRALSHTNVVNCVN